MKDNLLLTIYILTYSLVFALSMSSFIIFRPFFYVDNDTSTVVCNKDQKSYEISPNLIYSVDQKLDPGNDKKARKLCEYQIISDYTDVYKAPMEKNYIFAHSMEQESSWPNAVFAAFLIFFLGSAFVELILRRILRIKQSYLFGKYFWRMIFFLIE